MPPTDPRYLNATREEILVDTWAHRFADDPELHNEVSMDDEDFQAELERMEAAAAADGAQGDQAPGEEWEDLASDTYGSAEP